MFGHSSVFFLQTTLSRMHNNNKMNGYHNDIIYTIHQVSFIIHDRVTSSFDSDYLSPEPKLEIAKLENFWRIYVNFGEIR